MIVASVRRLEVFKTVVERNGVSAAAEFLGIAQPSVTAHIKALERQIGGLLFTRQRGRRHLSRTAAGDALFDYACDTLSKTREVEAKIQRVHAVETQGIRIAAPRLVANNLLPPILAETLAKNPSAEITLHSETHERVWDLVQSGAVDIGFNFAQAKPAKQIAREIGYFDLVFIASPTHVLSRSRSVTVRDLAAHPFVGGLADSGFYRLVSDELARIGLTKLRVVLHLQDGIAVKRAVAEGAGIACAFRHTVQDDVARGELVMLPLAGPQPRLCLFSIKAAKSEPSRLRDSIIKQIETKLAKVIASRP